MYLLFSLKRKGAYVVPSHDTRYSFNFVSFSMVPPKSENSENTEDENRILLSLNWGFFSKFPMSTPVLFIRDPPGVMYMYLYVKIILKCFYIPTGLPSLLLSCHPKKEFENTRLYYYNTCIFEMPFATVLSNNSCP